jgi:hypothetical protein
MFLSFSEREIRHPTGHCWVPDLTNRTGQHRAPGYEHDRTDIGRRILKDLVARSDLYQADPPLEVVCNSFENTNTVLCV